MAHNEGMNTNSTSTASLRNVAGTNWITGTVDGLEVQAKVYDEPSHFGMELDGRISKLSVKMPGEDGLVLYSYDRGLDIDYLNTEGLAMVVAAVAARIGR